MGIHQCVGMRDQAVVQRERSDVSRAEKIPQGLVPAGEDVKSCTLKSGPSKGCTIRTRIFGIISLHTLQGGRLQSGRGPVYLSHSARLTGLAPATGPDHDDL